MFETGLFTYLSAVGRTSAGTRVYPRRLPQGATLPAIVYFKVSGGLTYTSASSSLAMPRFQMDCWGSTYLAAKTLAEEVKAAMSGYRGAMGSETVTAAFIEDEQDDDEPETGQFCTRLDVVIHHQ